MKHVLKRHPIPIKAFFRHSLVLTYAYPADLLRPLLPPGLILDEFEGSGFVAVAMVQTTDLRPAFMPRGIGQDFFLTGYRIFARYKSASGRLLRGLRILRSDTDRRLMAIGGNLLTHYNYRVAKVRCVEENDHLEIKVRTPNAEADVDVRARLSPPATGLPAGSPFKDLRQARQFAGPLPFTFDYEKETHSLILIEGVRKNWKPEPVEVDIGQVTFLDRAPFNKVRPVLANAFHVRDISYQWKRGVREPLGKSP